ncbi:MAG: hypothetical protein KDC12_02670 [Flavobacteriales bacterium]|nr:hypothetical protein [Flavobacteriales bacterium]
MKPRQCIHCHTEIVGRADKKFCDAMCRSAYFYRRHTQRAEEVRRINTILNNNRKILLQLIEAGSPQASWHRIQLEKLGFAFRFCTHTIPWSRKTEAVFCYDVGYIQVNDRITIIEPDPLENMLPQVKAS